MAMSRDFSLDSGLNFRNSYIRIDTISGYKEELIISVNIYISREFFKEGKGYINQKSYMFKPSIAYGSENFIKQGYEYIKELPEFLGSMNVPEDCSAD